MNWWVDEQLAETDKSDFGAWHLEVRTLKIKEGDSVESERVLILKVVRDDMTSHAGFKWPESGEVKPERWDPSAQCGNGLHGWLNGEGDYRHEFMEGKWVVFSANPEDVVTLDSGDKVKARCGVVEFVGTQAKAVAYLKAAGAITEETKPGWCCFGFTQLQELAFRAANRAVKKYAPKALRARGLEVEAVKLESVPDIVDRQSAAYAAYAAYAANAANAVNYAANYAAANAANAANAAAYAANAAYSANAANYAANYAANNAAEREEQRLDKLELLGFKVRG